MGLFGGAKSGSGGSGGKHALSRQQVTGKPSRSTAGKGKNVLSKSSGKHAKNSGGKGGAAGGLDKWG